MEHTADRQHPEGGLSVNSDDIAMDLFGKPYQECTIMEQKCVDQKGNTVDERWGEVHNTDEMA